MNLGQWLISIPLKLCSYWRRERRHCLSYPFEENEKHSKLIAITYHLTIKKCTWWMKTRCWPRIWIRFDEKRVIILIESNESMAMRLAAFNVSSSLIIVSISRIFFVFLFFSFKNRIMVDEGKIFYFHKHLRQQASFLADQNIKS